MKAYTRRALVTGAGGFIGRRLCVRLREDGYFVRGVSRSSPKGNGPWHEYIGADLGASPDLSPVMEGIDVVFHVAGRAHVTHERDDADGAFEAANVRATRLLAEASAGAGIRRVLVAGSVAVFGRTGGATVQEDTNPCPVDAYGESKLRAEDAVRAAVAEPVVLRLPLVYGAGAPGNLDRMIRGVVRRRFPPPPRISNRRSMIHVDDVASAFALAAADPSAIGVYTVTDGRGYATHEIYDAIVAALGRRATAIATPAAPLRLAARLGDVIGAATGRRFPLDSQAWEKLFGSAVFADDRIRRELGFVPKWTLDRAMPEMVARYRQ